MGLFTPKISSVELARVRSLLKQMNNTTKTVNTTVNPEIYFGRLNYLFDLILALKNYEKYHVFTGQTPSQNYSYLTATLEKSVNDFIDRSFYNQIQKTEKLKTDKSKENSMKRYIEKMQSAFQNANSFWSGNTGEEHYKGRLYTPSNIEYFNNKIKHCKYAKFD